MDISDTVRCDGRVLVTDPFPVPTRIRALKRQPWGGNMPLAGLGVHVVLAIRCANHAVRARRQTYRLGVLFALLLLVRIVQVFAVFLPE